MPRTKSTEALDRLNQGIQKNTLQCRPLQQTIRSITRKGPVVPENLRVVSRLELLLAPKQAKKVFKPAEDSEESRRVNRAVKFSAQWTEVRRAVGLIDEISAGNAAYAVYRLGCLSSFASKKRNADMAASGIVPALLEVANAGVHTLDAGSLTLLLDGCARLEQRPPTATLEELAAAAERMAKTFDCNQLSLVLWAFETLQFTPKKRFLVAFDNAVDRLAAAMSPQAICLTLRGFQAPKYRPNPRTLTRLAEGLQRMLLLFKPSEIATCLEAFSFFGFQPAQAIVDAIVQQTGQPLHADKSVGKRPLAVLRACPNPIEGIIEKHAKFVEQGPQVASDHVAAARKLLRQASAGLSQSLKPKGTEWDAMRLG